MESFLGCQASRPVSKKTNNWVLKLLTCGELHWHGYKNFTYFHLTILLRQDKAHQSMEWTSFFPTCAGLSTLPPSAYRYGFKSFLNLLSPGEEYFRHKSTFRVYLGIDLHFGWGLNNSVQILLNAGSVPG